MTKRFNIGLIFMDFGAHKNRAPHMSGHRFLFFG